MTVHGNPLGEQIIIVELGQIMAGFQLPEGTQIINMRVQNKGSHPVDDFLRPEGSLIESKVLAIHIKHEYAYRASPACILTYEDLEDFKIRVEILEQKRLDGWVPTWDPAWIDPHSHLENKSGNVP